MRTQILDKALIVLGLMMFAYQMVTTQYLFVGSYEHQAIHLGFIFALLFTYQAKVAKSLVGVYVNLALAVAGVAACAYVFLNIVHLEEVFGFPDPVDLVVGIALIVLVIAGTRAAWGWTLPIVALIFIAYFLWGDLLLGQLYHRPYKFDYVVSYLSIGLSGVFGTFLGISANQVFLFVVFGALLGIIRVHDFFMEVGKVAGRNLRGGPGQTAVVSSALLGMISGAAVANVAIVGAFTIPFMKKVGYRPEHAGAIEATASTGGQIMPPVMGAAAFLMASFLGVSYDVVMLAGIIPAILYFWGVMLGVQFLAVRDNIRPPIETVNWRLMMRRFPLFGIPLGVMIFMLIQQYSPANAAAWSIVTAIALSYVDPQTRPKFGALLKSLANGAMIGAQIGISLAIVGIVAQTMITTGLGNKIAGLVEIISGGNLFITLLMTMLVSLILGCGVPTSAAYSLVAIAVIPIVIKMGVDPLSAHFFAFYFAVISSLTPPVALASLAGASLAEAPYFRTSMSAFKLAISGFIIPFLIVYNPLLTFSPTTWEFAIGTIIAVPLAMTAFTAAIYGCGLTVFTTRERILTALTAACLFGYSIFRHLDSLPLEYPLLILGLIGFAAVSMSQLRARRQPAVAASPNPI